MKTLPEEARILVVKTHAIGDLLMATPALRDLRAAYPKASITLLVGKHAAPAVRRNPHLDALIEVDDAVFLRGRNRLRLAALLWRIRRLRFDAAIVFHPLPAIHLFARLAGIPLRYGLSNSGGARHLTAGYEEDLRPGSYYPANFQGVTALAGASPGPPDLEAHHDADDAAEAAGLLAAGGVAAGESYLLAAPGGARNPKEDVAARRWPVERFIELLESVRRDHPGLRVVLTGGRGDLADSGRIARAIPGAVDLTGRTSLRALFALARGARAVVCNDSSMLHVAVAVGTPPVVPFGPTGLRQRVPEWAHGYSIQAETACSPCYVGGRFPGCPIGFECLRELPARAVRERLDRALLRA